MKPIVCCCCYYYYFDVLVAVAVVVAKTPHFNPLSPKIHIQILHTFLLRVVERTCFKIKASPLW